ncbi:protein EXORDIUM [Sorghum bicolor]|uniref:Uncharacterized protein n=1 Tax=Sorghum bicolor TaxID=4558 RepID=C5XYB7_SORBI|nr:protein EXORDIUM [Sorghum bicolor]EES05498.1 hypothetical protein SORBI_3004G229500 [Sorghum bicolor]|eukprot:XP_002452522.1 protein EXORDIUM [Sorghum bicolor]
MASLVLVVAMVLSLSQLSVGSRRLMELYIPPPSDQLTDHHGGVLSGDIRVTTLWYGSFTSAQKSIVYDFLLSLTAAPSATATPSVGQWWGTIDQLYLSSAAASGTRVLLDARTQVSDEAYSLGKSLTLAQLEQLAARAGAKKGGIALVFTDENVAVEGFCSSRCGKHGSAAPGAEVGSTYIWVGNAVKQCPGQCAWPFAQPLYGPQGAPLVAPNGDAGMDGLVMVLASMVAGTVTNPYRDGFYQGSKDAPLEACTACPGVYGSGAYPGFPGSLLVDQTTGGSYNANGVNGRKYLLPALYNPATSTCNTLV